MLYFSGHLLIYIILMAADGRYAALQLEFSAAVKTSAEQKELIFKLEHDLSTIQAMSSLSRPDAEESRSLQQTLQALQSELDSLRADNIKLYEKIKFLQSYPTRSGGSDDTVMRYSTQYEERLDPFSSFSKKVLYKTAWSESIGRDCAAYCAKKYSDHLHRFHENGENGDMWQ
ncbi:Protein CASP [Bagarius yarrelli]|uniref:Protein CASP n=1 Tax=Bagarius yarrelli TaxID=175774 RepID=A0A556U6D5_BAGYA|nr:Protein CASP [Bagarius yarrelli]